MPAKKADVARVFHALGDPTRRLLMERLSAADKLAGAPMSVSQLAAPMKMSLAAVVQHLQILEESGLVVTEKTGRVRTCRIDPAGLSVASDWISERKSVWEKRLQRLGDLLAEAE